MKMERVMVQLPKRPRPSWTDSVGKAPASVGSSVALWDVSLTMPQQGRKDGDVCTNQRNGYQCL